MNELIRGIRNQMTHLIEGLEEAQLKAMQLGLGHTLSRYKLKFSPDKVDTMIVQAIGLLDELDKEINTYAMRVKEWYGWHFPEVRCQCRRRRRPTGASSRLPTLTCPHGCPSPPPPPVPALRACA